MVRKEKYSKRDMTATEACRELTEAFPSLCNMCSKRCKKAAIILKCKWFSPLQAKKPNKPPIKKNGSRPAPRV